MSGRATDWNSAEVEFQQASAAHHRGDLGKARVLCENIIKRQPGHADALHLLGVISFYSGDCQTATDFIGQAIAISPRKAIFHSNHGNAYQGLKQFAAAVDSYDCALALRPDLAEVHYNRGNALHELGQHHDAVDSYDRAIVLRPDLAEAHYSRGVALAKLQQREAALASYDNALALCPTMVDAHYNRANILAELEEPAAAIAGYDRVIALRPDFAPAHYNRGNALQGIERLNEAVASYDRAIALRSGLALAHYNRSNALTKLKRSDEALNSYRQAVKIAPQQHRDVRRALLLHHYVTLEKPADISRLIQEMSELRLQEELAGLSPGNAVQAFRVLHDLEQMEYLLAQGYRCDGLAEAGALLQRAYDRSCSEGTAMIQLSGEEIAAIKCFKKNLLRYQMPSDIAACLNPEKNWQAIEDEYFSNHPEIIHIDNFLSERALVELRKFCLVSTIWTLEYSNQYLGAFVEDGFISPLHLQIADELRAKMPRIFGGQTFEQLWGFKYDAKTGGGINVHADFARVNLNFWITPDSANLDPASGGLIVYDAPAPRSWNFREYNGDHGKMYEFLAARGAGHRKIPYRCNRAVMFNSSLFHETDAMRFKEGYENRRINVTYLFGRGSQDE